MKLQLPIHSYELRSIPASPARLVNCAPELLPPDSKSPVLLTRTPGIKSWTTVGDGPIHTMKFVSLAIDGVQTRLLFVVSGQKLYSVTQGKVVTEIGTVGTPVNVSIASNFDSVVVVNEPHGYAWDGTTFEQIVDENFVSRGAGDVVFLDDFLVFREPGSGRFFSANSGSVTEFSGLMFATAEASPDALAGMAVEHRQLILFGDENTEIWQNVGTTPFPFGKSSSGLVQIGCANRRTVVTEDNTVFWLADDLTVRRLDGLTPLKVSTPAVEQKIPGYTISRARAYSYTMDGHAYYVLTFPEATWVYDISTGSWHERQTYGRKFWQAGPVVNAWNTLLVGDSLGNSVGEIDPEVYADWSTPSRMEWTYQPVYADGKRAFHYSLEVIMETGVGLATGQGSIPRIMAQYSDDGGLSWKALPDQGIGKVGETSHRVRWDALGSARQRVYRCAISDPVKVTVTDTVLDVVGGRI